MKPFEDFKQLAADKPEQFSDLLDQIDEKLVVNGALVHMNRYCIWVTEGDETVWEIAADEFEEMTSSEVMFSIREDLESLLERYE